MDTKHVYEKYPPNDPSVLIPILQDIQDVDGFLSEDEMNKVAQFTKLPVSRIYGVATFYNQFRLTPLGKNIIRVCRGTACHVKGSLDILNTLENELEIKAGETTKDLMFSLETVACIGACSIAPVISINDEYHGHLTVKKIQKILSSYRKTNNEE